MGNGILSRSGSGDGAKIGAGAVVSQDVPAGCTVVCQPPRILNQEEKHV